jgi:hypothetical protein
MRKSGGSVGTFVASVAPEKRRADADTLITMMRDITGREPELWGTIIGFGSCHYRYPTGNDGDMPLLSFAPRKAASTVYLDNAERHRDALELLGPHTTGAGCLYLKDLEKVDLDVLRGVLERTYDYAVSGGDDDVALTVTD